ncbi:carbohydrate-binding module family 20 domain-containing protein [Streptomyces sp. NPDC002580]|uniref:carbohydrate-binding module family 20 domain-containing protein n=1 Tax=Streptomyces sp. NPDC002580 TaxID=3364653 RepID=UPI0036CF5814
MGDDVIADLFRWNGNSVASVHLTGRDRRRERQRDRRRRARGHGRRQQPLHGQQLQPCGQVSVAFDEYPDTYYRQNVDVVGSIPAPGNRNTAAVVPLSAAGCPTWSTALTSPSSSSFAYKYVKKNPDGTITRESDPHRSCTTPASGAVTLDDSWR